MSGLDSAVERLCKLLAAVGLLGLIAFAVATLANGISRSLLSYPIEFVSDIGNLVVAVAVASCFPMALWLKSNIRIDIFGGVLPGLAHSVLGILADVAVLGVTSAVARQMFIYADHQAEAGDTTVMLEIATAPFWYYVAAMFAIAACVQAVVTGWALRAVLSGAARSDPAKPLT